MIAIVDTGGANHTSVQDALMRLGHDSLVTTDPSRIQSASHVILPGVGHAGFAMKRLNEHQLVPIIRDLKQPILGICLGLHLLLTTSDEGDVNCLGLLPGRVSKLKPTNTFRVPNMGWSKLKRIGKDSILLHGVDIDAYFYFVHSYHAPLSSDVVAQLQDPQIPAVMESGNLYATQFHPERSGVHGAQILKNFLAIGTSA